MTLGLVAQLGPEEAKTIGAVTIMVTAILGAVLYPVARAFARRLDRGVTSAATREELAALSARLMELQRGQQRVAELEERLDFAERLLTQQRDPQRLNG